METVESGTSYTEVLIRMTSNAGVAAEGFRLDVDSLFSTFYGLPLTQHSRTSHDAVMDV